MLVMIIADSDNLREYFQELHNLVLMSDLI
jgi:hypothetical protein